MGDEKKTEEQKYDPKFDHRHSERELLRKFKDPAYRGNIRRDIAAVIDKTFKSELGH